MTATLQRSKYALKWDSYSYFVTNDETETGGIYSQKVTIHAVGDYRFEVSFRVGDGRTLGILFAEVVMIRM